MAFPANHATNKHKFTTIDIKISTTQFINVGWTKAKVKVKKDTKTPR